MLPPHIVQKSITPQTTDFFLTTLVWIEYKN
jgi:hypothetical protein